MLILAAVSINLVLGDNGVLVQSTESAVKTDIAETKEKIEYALVGRYDTAGNYTTQDVIDSAYEVTGNDVDENTGTVLTEIGNTVDILYLLKSASDYIDWDAILANLEDDDARAEYLAEAITSGQDSSIEDVAIGTDGSVVNLSLWTYRRTTDGKGVVLNNKDNCGVSGSGYDNNNIQADGTIIGTVPQYVYLKSYNAVYDVTSMFGTFYKCSNLVIAPELPSTVQSLLYCFEDCTSLLSVPDVPDSVTNLNYAFYGCSSLKYLKNISNSVTEIYYTFGNCSSLTSTPLLPDSITKMSCAFYNCMNLSKITNFPNSVTNLNLAFYCCSSLTEVPRIPDSVESLSSTFYGCTSLVSVQNIPSSTKYLDSAFYNCENLTGTIQVDATSLKVRDSCFKGTSKSIVLTGSSETVLKALASTATNGNVTYVVN